ncbi:CRFR1 factor, partial [Polypterus senegalus]
MAISRVSTSSRGLLTSAVTFMTLVTLPMKSVDVLGEHGGPEVTGEECVVLLISAKGRRSKSLESWSIRCLRNIIHWNLITAFILRNATWFVVQMTMNPEVHESNVIWCRLVTAAYNYFHVTNFFWMFGEGCYLHTAIVLTYSTDKLRKWMFICIGWCIPFPIIVAWAIGKLYYDNEKCWFGKRAGVYTDYIYQGPMILVLLINFIFLFNIVRILMTKLRASTTSETIQYRKAVKATLVLLPLLGITYMLFFVNPGEDEISRVVFIYFNSFLESFQAAVWHALNHYAYRDAVFLAERLYAEVHSEEALFLLATCYYRSGKAYKAYRLLKGHSCTTPQCKYLLAKCCVDLNSLCYKMNDSIFSVDGFLYNVISILGSDNCLFLSVGYFLTHTVDKGNALSLRHRAVDFVASHWDRFGDVLAVVPSNASRVITTSHEYHQCMATSGVYGGEAEIQALSEILRATIVIYFLQTRSQHPTLHYICKDLR